MHADLRHYSQTLKSYTKGADWQAALLLLDDLDKAGAANVILYSVAVTSCERGQQLALGISLLRRAERQKIQPDTVMYNTLISSCATSSQWPCCVHVLSQLKQAAVPADVISFNSALKGFRCTSVWFNALILQQQIGQARLQASVVTMNSIISCDAGWPRALESFAWLQQEKLPADLVTYNAVQAASPWPRAFSFLRSIRREGLEPDVVTSGALVAGSRWEWSLQHLQSDFPTNAVAYNACLALLPWHGAMHVLKLIRFQQLRVTARTHNILLSTARAAGRWKAGFHAVEQRRGLGLAEDQVTCHISMKLCDWAFATQLLRRMQALTLRSDLISYSSLMSPSSGQPWELSLALLAQLQGISLERDLMVQNTVTSSIAADTAWQLSASLLTQLPLVQLRVDAVAYSEVAVALARGALWQKTLQSAWGAGRRVRPVGVVSFNAAVSSMEREGRWDWALCIMNSLQDDRLEATSITCNAALSACGKREEWSTAVELFARAQRRFSPSLITFNALIGTCHWRRSLCLWLKLKRSWAD
ncbi:unnamed protein product [Durusdinium trenchii]|uniref:Pentatricopeptide repeat-containing protein, chloroplastic n=1 Tax=Durusdinium trenchii TaxID=1381693 RepID=A0ABP0RKQ9_9DINO